MEIIDLLRKLLPSEIVDNFDIVRFEKTFDEKKIQEEEDEVNENIIAYGFSDYKIIQDFPLRGRFTHLHLRKRKWLDKSTARYSATASTHQNMKGHGSMQSSWIFLKRSVETTTIPIVTIASTNGGIARQDMYIGSIKNEEVYSYK